MYADRMRGWCCVVACIALVGCAGTLVDFAPYSATAVKRPVTDSAVFAYAGDVPLLKKARGVLVGTVIMTGNAFTSRDDLRERALREAAARGGTHVFIENESAMTSFAKLTPDRAVTTVNGNTATTTFRPGASVPVTFHGGRFVVVRISPERWHRLPPQLRPEPNPYAQEVMASRAEDGDPDDSEDSGSAVSNAVAESVAKPASWYCQSGDNAERCYRKKSTCERADEEVSCDGEDVAYCFAARDKGADEDSDAELQCLSTVNGCHVARDAAFAHGAAIVNECAASK